MRQPVCEVGYAPVIASRKDAVMYLATIWYVVMSDNNADVSEQILFEQIRHSILESLRIRGWLGEKSKSDEELIPPEEYNSASWGGKGGIREWLQDLGASGRVLLKRSLVADIYRVIWRDGSFSIGEKRVVEQVVAHCGLDSNVAYSLCFNIGLAEYFGKKVVETVESGMSVEPPMLLN